MRIFIFFLIFFCIILSHAKEYNYKQPVKSTVLLTCTKETINLECSFRGTTLFNNSISAKVNSRHSISLCYAALKEFFNIKGEISISGLYQSKPLINNNNKLTYFYTVPVNGIKNARPPAKISDNGNSVKASEKNSPPISKINIAVNNKQTTQELITEDYIENLQLTGYYIRCKNDIIAFANEIKSNFIKDCLNNHPDTLDILVNYIEILRSQRIYIKNKLNNDPLLVNSDIKFILAEYDKYTLSLEKSMRTQGRNIKQKILYSLKTKRNKLDKKSQTYLFELKEIDEIITLVDSRYVF